MIYYLLLFSKPRLSFLNLFVCFSIYKFIGMTDKSPLSKKPKSKSRQYVTFSSTNKAFSDRPLKKNEGDWTSKSSSKPIPETLTYLLMKQKFEQIYKHIEKISLKDEQMVIKSTKKEGEDVQSNTSNQQPTSNSLSPEICRLNTSQLNKKCSLPNVMDTSLQINTVSAPEYRSRAKASPLLQAQIMRRSRYKKKALDPIKDTKPKMSNNIKDYLSVQKISMKEIEESFMSNKLKGMRNQNHSNLLSYNNPQNEGNENLQMHHSDVMISNSPTRHRPENILLRRIIRFKAPFDTYYYRDFTWKIAYSNEFIVEPPEEYETKVKYYVGPGNNSNLIKGIIRRRPWFQLTDKVQDAQFVWTQIKIPTIFAGQRKGDPMVAFGHGENNEPLTKSTKGKTFSLFNNIQNQKWNSYWGRNMQKQRLMKQNLKVRSKIFGLMQHNQTEVRSKIKVHNHFCNNFMIGNKKALFQTMSEYYTSKGQRVFDFLPLTFHIKNGLEDDEYLKFLKHFYAIAKENKNNPDSIHKYNAWIIKPGENTNRGNGIIVCLELSEIKAILKTKETHNDGTSKTYILQKYIERPLLYKKRKFDLRHYIMLNCVNGKMKGYWYKHGYVRTTSSQYTLKISSGSVHLTNDAVQKNLPDYGRYQKGNKITYEDLDSFMKKNDPEFDFFEKIYPQMKRVARDAIHASALNIDPLRRVNNFEIFGLDFMIDANYDVWLIEINTNPCLETTCPVLSKIIPKFVENTFQICIDPLFPAPLNFQPKYDQYYKNLSEDNDFQVVFDQRIDQANSIGETVLANQPEEEDDVFDDDGQDFAD